MHTDAHEIRAERTPPSAVEIRNDARGTLSHVGDAVVEEVLYQASEYSLSWELLSSIGVSEESIDAAMTSVRKYRQWF